jgi:hypothetical protein
MIAKKLMMKVGDVSVFLVDGNEVKKLYNMDFVEGGNDKAYPTFIPKGEIWIDKLMAPKEWIPIMVHELAERLEMARGKSYEEAHPDANAVERQVR